MAPISQARSASAAAMCRWGAFRSRAEMMAAYKWPGNVRELRNAMERAVITARKGWIETVHLPPFLRQGGRGRKTGIQVTVGTSVAEAEKKLVLETLRQMDNNKTRAAKALGIDVRTIRYKLRAWEDDD